MSWVKLDDQFFRHPKVRMAGKDGRVLFLAGLCYCASQLTDGFIPAGMVGLLVSEAEVKKTAVRDLKIVGLWEEAEGGYLVHDYLDFNPSAEQVKAERSWAAQRRELHSDPALVAAIRERDQNGCRYCGKDVNWKDRRGPLGGTYDHVIPRGPNTLENVVVSCRGCNAAKGSRTPDQAGMSLLPARSELDPSQVRPSHPSPSRPTDVVTSSSTTSLLGADDELWKLVAQRRLTQSKAAGQSINNEGAWLAEVARNAKSELALRAKQLRADYPTIEQTQLADVLNGNTNILQALPRGAA